MKKPDLINRLITMAVAALLVSCGKSVEPPEPVIVPTEKPVVAPIPLSVTTFSFTAAANPKLSADVNCRIFGDSITAFIPELQTDVTLIPTFSGEFDKAEVNGVIQTPGLSQQDFSRTVVYRFYKGNDVLTFRVYVSTFTGLPIVTIQTVNMQPVLDRENWVEGDISIQPTPTSAGFEGAMKMRGRGNATWFYEKKPYRFKFESKTPILGMPSDKEWVLLADYCDKSLLRTSYGFVLSRLAGLPWTPRGQHVELFMNGAYQGTYYLCEHVKAATNRANIAANGFLIERDNYWNLEPLWFGTVRNNHYTFRYPDPDDINADHPYYKFARDFVNSFETALYSDDFKDPETGYARYIDVQNFAQWFLIQEMLGNIDTNPYMALESREGKLKMYPVWDFEWSLGLAAPGNNGWAMPPATSPVAMAYWKNNVYYDRLFSDPAFVDIVREEWQKFKYAHLTQLLAEIDAIVEKIKLSQAENFRRWPILGQYVSVNLVAFPTWKEEVNYARHFLLQRVEWLDSEIKKW
ncbi:MAG: CotH kinase family protein [Bacteroidales bacterium]|jgi:hypothetical protein|nr:CotH kinase family protein [Bacteroidales bacterium]